jgi:hypothetical protein
MKFPTWSLLVFPILAIVLIIMLPILAIAVAVSVAIWAFIAAQKAAATKTQDKRALGENEVQALAAPDDRQALGALGPHHRLSTMGLGLIARAGGNEYAERRTT